MKRLIVLLCLVFTIATGGNAQNYIHLGDFSGFEIAPSVDVPFDKEIDTIFQILALEDDFTFATGSFYIYNDLMNGGSPAVLDKMVTDVAANSPYYILIAPEFDHEGTFNKVHVVSELPGDLSGCLNESKIEALSEIVSYKITNSYQENSDLNESVNIGIKKCKTFLNKSIGCCVLTKSGFRSLQCDTILELDDAHAILLNEGYVHLEEVTVSNNASNYATDFDIFSLVSYSQNSDFIAADVILNNEINEQFANSKTQNLENFIFSKQIYDFEGIRNVEVLKHEPKPGAEYGFEETTVLVIATDDNGTVHNRLYTKIVNTYLENLEESDNECSFNKENRFLPLIPIIARYLIKKALQASASVAINFLGAWAIEKFLVHPDCGWIDTFGYMQISWTEIATWTAEGLTNSTVAQCGIAIVSAGLKYIQQNGSNFDIEGFITSFGIEILLGCTVGSGLYSRIGGAFVRKFSGLYKNASNALTSSQAVNIVSDFIADVSGNFSAAGKNAVDFFKDADLFSAYFVLHKFGGLKSKLSNLELVKSLRNKFPNKKIDELQEEITSKGFLKTCIDGLGCFVEDTPILMAGNANQFSFKNTGRALAVAAAMPIVAVPIQEVQLLDYAVAHETVNSIYGMTASTDEDIYLGLLDNDPYTSDQQRERDEYVLDEVNWYEVVFEEVNGSSTAKFAFHDDWINQKSYRLDRIIEMNLPEQGISGPFKITSIKHIIPQKKPEDDDPNDKYGYRPVTALFTHVSDDVYTIGFDNGEQLGVTYKHPIFSLTAGDWKLAGELEFGEKVLARDGGTIVISKKLDNSQIVYNLEVKDYHNFLVNPSGIVVHNTGNCIGVYLKRFFKSDAKIPLDDMKWVSYSPHSGLATKDLHEWGQLERLGEKMQKQMVHLDKTDAGIAFPGIDGFIDDGIKAIPVSLKEVTSKKIGTLGSNIKAIGERATTANGKEPFNGVMEDITGMITAKEFTFQKIKEKIISVRDLHPENSKIVKRYFIEGKDISDWVVF